MGYRSARRSNSRCTTLVTSRCLTRTPPALQVRISPNSLAPGARAGGPLRGAVSVLIRFPPSVLGEARGAAPRRGACLLLLVLGVGSDGEGAVDAGLGRV